MRPFETLDHKIAAGLLEIVHGEFEREIMNHEEKLGSQVPPRPLTGRAIAWMIYDKNKTSEIEGTILEFEDLLAEITQPFIVVCSHLPGTGPLAVH